MNAEHLNSTPARWWTVLGLVLVPLLVAGGFLLAGMHADDRLHTVQAAVVNLDEPVTLDGQYTPLGRQLTANLVDSDRQQNLTWVLQNETEARAGLADGRFAAMVIIPENFSAAATSFAEDADQAKQAEIRVYTSPVAGVADATLGKLVANEAAAMLNQTLTQSYLENIYIGFNDMGDQFVTLADGSSDLADGAEQLADGLGEAADGSGQLSTGMRKLADGTGDYVDGVKKLVNQTIDSLPGQAQMIQGLRNSADGAAELSGGLGQYQSELRTQAQAASQGAQGVGQALAAVDPSVPATIGAAQAAVQAACGFTPAPEELATKGAGCVGSLQGAAQALNGAADGLGSAGTKNTLLYGASNLAGGLDSFASAAAEQAPDVAKTTKQLKQLKAGGAELASGADELADGISQFSDGINDAASGATKLADGMREMADGIADGKDNVPSFNQTERENLSTVVASPIDTDDLHGLADGNVGWVSLILVLALWLGALATYVVIKAINRGLLNSAEPSYLLIGKALLPGIAVVGAQAVAMAVLAWFGFELSWQKWLAASGVLLLAGITFVVINHALVAWLDGIGRLVSVLFAVLTAAAAMSGAAPGIFAALRPFSPLSPALDAVRAIVTESSGAATSTLTLVGWLLLALVASAVAIVRKRTTTLEAVVAAG